MPYSEDVQRLMSQLAAERRRVRGLTVGCGKAVLALRGERLDIEAALVALRLALRPSSGEGVDVDTLTTIYLSANVGVMTTQPSDRITAFLAAWAEIEALRREALRLSVGGGSTAHESRRVGEQIRSLEAEAAARFGVVAEDIRSAGRVLSTLTDGNGTRGEPDGRMR